ncbi:MAG: hypothetical protein H6529_06225 [Nocardioides sp.]|nr:hypothetical protein [Nocardioides sp.]
MLVLGLAASLAVVLGRMTSAPDAGPTRVLLVGDSVTQGSSGDWTWRYRLWKHFRDVGADVDLVGPDEDLAGPPPGVRNLDYADPDFDRDHAGRWGKAFTSPDWPVDRLVAAYHPDVVVELLGVNDALWSGATAEQLLEDAEQFVADARTADPDVDIVLGGLPQRWETAVAAYDDRLDALAERLDTARSRVIVARAPEVFVQEVDTYDAVHPSASGEVKIAAGVADALAGLGIGAPYPRPLPTVPPVPTHPAVLSARPGPGSAVLSWEPPPGGWTAYVWLRDVSVGEQWRRLPVPVAGTTWTAGGLVPGDTHEIRVQMAKGTSISELFSNVVTVVPEPI